MALKINLGAGYKKIDGFLTIDDDPLTNPDYLLNIEKDKLPFENNSVEYVIAHHILEHIGEGFIPLMKELHRVCAHGAIIDILAPHHFHELFYNDPTHRRPITVESMKLFSKKYNTEMIKVQSSSSGMGLKYDIDFEIAWYGYNYDAFYEEYRNDYYTRKEQNKTTPQEDMAFVRLHREATNVAVETMIKLVAIKE